MYDEVALRLNFPDRRVATTPIVNAANAPAKSNSLNYTGPLSLDHSDWVQITGTGCGRIADSGSGRRHNGVVSDPLAAHGIPANLKSYVCIEVFNRERPVLLVTRPDGDWCFLCGANHPDDASSYRVVGIGHPFRDDPTLEEVLDLDIEEEAERAFLSGPWSRTRL